MVFLCNNFTLFYTATAGNGDFVSLSDTLTFAPGLGNGSLTCLSVTTNADNLVEPEEHFIVELALVTPEEASFRLGNPRTVVTLIDSDGMRAHIIDNTFLVVTCSISTNGGNYSQIYSAATLNNNPQS